VVLRPQHYSTLLQAIRSVWRVLCSRLSWSTRSPITWYPPLYLSSASKELINHITSFRGCVLQAIAYADGHPIDIYDMSCHTLFVRVNTRLPPQSNRILSLLSIPNTTLLVGNTVDAVLV
jgi:hypothetical protein